MTFDLVWDNSIEEYKEIILWKAIPHSAYDEKLHQLEHKMYTTLINDGINIVFLQGKVQFSIPVRKFNNVFENKLEKIIVDYTNLFTK